MLCYHGYENTVFSDIIQILWTPYHSCKKLTSLYPVAFLQAFVASCFNILPFKLSNFYVHFTIWILLMVFDVDSNSFLYGWMKTYILQQNTILPQSAWESSTGWDNFWHRIKTAGCSNMTANMQKVPTTIFWTLKTENKTMLLAHQSFSFFLLENELICTFHLHLYKTLQSVCSCDSYAVLGKILNSIWPLNSLALSIHNNVMLDKFTFIKFDIEIWTTRLKYSFHLSYDKNFMLNAFCFTCHIFRA